MKARIVGLFLAGPLAAVLAACGSSGTTDSSESDASRPVDEGGALDAGESGTDDGAVLADTGPGPISVDGSGDDASEGEDASPPLDASTLDATPSDATVPDATPSDATAPDASLDAADSATPDEGAPESSSDTSAPDADDASAPGASIEAAAPSPDASAPDAGDSGVPCVIAEDAWTATVSQPTLPPEIAPVVDSVLTVALPANDFLYDPYTGLLYASIPSSFGANGNSIARVDPTTGAVVGSVYVGSEPGPLAESADGQFLYVGLTGAHAVRRYVLATQTPDIQFSFAESTAVYDVAVTLAVLPTSPHSVLVAAGGESSGWVGVYDDGVARSALLLEEETNEVVSTGSDALALAPPSEYPSGTTDVLCIDSLGVHLSRSITAPITNELLDSAPYYGYASGILYSESGRALDAVSGLLAGTYGTAGGAVAVEPRVDRVFFLTGPQIVSYTLDHFTPAGSISLTAPWNESSRLVRWGRYGFAFLSGTGGSTTQIAIVRTSLVPVGP